jgi:hypothetical protein
MKKKGKLQAAYNTASDLLEALDDLKRSTGFRYTVEEDSDKLHIATNIPLSPHPDHPGQDAGTLTIHVSNGGLMDAWGDRNEPWNNQYGCGIKQENVLSLNGDAAPIIDFVKQKVHAKGLTK